MHVFGGILLTQIIQCSPLIVPILFHKLYEQGEHRCLAIQTEERVGGLPTDGEWEQENFTIQGKLGVIVGLLPIVYDGI